MIRAEGMTDMIDWLYRGDVFLFHLINTTWTSGFLDWVMPLFSDFHFWHIPIFVLAALMLVFGKYRARLFVILLLLGLLIGDTGVSQCIKKATHRARPFQVLADARHVSLRGVDPPDKPHRRTGNSMNSSHTANMVCAALLASALFYPWGRLVWVLAVLVAYSRIYTGNHYPSDVLISCFVALFTFSVLRYGGLWLWRHTAPKMAPALYEKYPGFFPGKPGRAFQGSEPI